MKFVLPYFGVIDSERLSECYESNFVYQGQPAELVLYASKTISEHSFKFVVPETLSAEEASQFGKIALLLADLDGLIARGKAAYQASFDARESVYEDYVVHHLAELAPAQLDPLLQGETNRELGLLRAVKLKSISFFAFVDDPIMMDFSIGAELTQYVISARFNWDGSLRELSIES